MAKQNINIGVSPNDGTGDVVREAFRKSKENFDELYARATGDMNKSTYDVLNTGAVDTADKVTGVDAAGNVTYYGKDAAGNIGFHSFSPDKVAEYNDQIAGFDGVLYIDVANFKLYLWDDVNEVYVSANPKHTATINDIATLKTFTAQDTDSAVEVLGYYAKGDGGGGSFYWDATSTETDNGGTIIKVTAVVTGRWKRRFSGAVNVKWFGAKGDGVTDDTLTIQSVVDFVYNFDKGEVFIPSGTFLVSSIIRNWSVSKTVNIKGNGEHSTILKKKAGTTTPVLDFSSDLGVLETYSSISDLRIKGDSKLNTGLKLTKNARFTLNKVRIDDCSIGIENNGALVFSAYDLSLQANNIGYKCLASGAIHPNLVQFFGGNISANTTLGVDIVNGNGIHFYGTDISANGTAADLTTGGVIIRDTADDEIGVSVMSFNNVWLELNKGIAFKTENVTNLSLTIKDSAFAANEGGNAIDIGVIRNANLINIIAASTLDVVKLNASNSFVSGGNIYTLTDTSTNKTHLNVALSTGSTKNTSTQFEVIGDSGSNLKLANDTIAGGVSADSTLSKAAGKLKFRFGANIPVSLSSTGIGFNGSSPYAKPTVPSIAGNTTPKTLIENLIAYLGAYGLITNNLSSATVLEFTKSEADGYYLPLTAGVSKPLSGDLNFTAGQKRVKLATSTIRDTGTSTLIISTETGGIYLRPNGDASSVNQLGITNTSVTFGAQEIYHEGNIEARIKATIRTFTAVQTYSVSPIVPTPTADAHAATKKYVDDKVIANRPVKNIPGDIYTLALEDKTKWLQFTHTGGLVTVTVPDAVFALNDELMGDSSGQDVVFVNGTGFTLKYPISKKAEIPKEGVFGIRFRAVNSAVIFGSLKQL